MISLAQKRKRSLPSSSSDDVKDHCKPTNLDVLVHFFKDPREAKIVLEEGKITPILSLQEGLTILAGISMGSINKSLLRGPLDPILHTLSQALFRAIFVISCQGDSFEVYPKTSYAHSSMWAHRNAFFFMVKDEDGYHLLKFRYKGKSYAFLLDSHLVEGNLHSLYSDPSQPFPLLTSLASSLVKMMPPNQVIFIE